MAKKLLFLIVLIASAFAQAQNKEHYILLIEGDSLKIDLNQDLNYKLKSGKTIDLKLVQPALLSYEDDYLSFLYPNMVTYSQTPVEDGLMQLMVMRATGNGLIIQEYDFLNPENLVDLMLNEITKESVSYGYSKTVNPVSLKFKSGETATGKEAVMGYNGETEVYSVLAYGKKDKGIIILRIQTVANKEDELIFDTIQDNFELKM